MGSAGLYLEEYFEEQLKEFYPDRIFPGGREEQMIPPLEDEIEEDEEEEMAAEDAAPAEEQRAPGPATGDGLPSVEEVKEARAGAAEEREAEAEKEMTTRDRGTDIVVKSEGDAPPTGTAEECQAAPEQAPQDSAAVPGEGKDAQEPSTAEEENLPLPTDSPVVPPEAQQEADEEAEEEPAATKEV